MLGSPCSPCCVSCCGGGEAFGDGTNYVKSAVGTGTGADAGGASFCVKRP